jgi:UDP-glucose 4-epimerase
MGNSVSLVELLSLIRELSRSTPVLQYAPARTGDQLVYVSDYSKLEHHTGWRPTLTVRDTLADILQWHNQNRALFKPSAEPVDVAAALEAVPKAA